MKALRTNLLNDGRPFQDELEIAMDAYENRGIARFARTMPPCRMVGKNKVIFLENPWLDFTGTWSANGGRAIVIEAKSHAERLPLERSGGITAKQLTNLVNWDSHKAAAFLLWKRGIETRLFTAKLLLADVHAGCKSVTWEGGWIVSQGTGKILWDFLPVFATSELEEKNKPSDSSSSPMTYKNGLFS